MEKKVKVLARNSAGSVMRCPGGVVHVNIPGVSLHLDDFQFVSLSRLVSSASEKLMDGAIKVLMEDTK